MPRVRPGVTPKIFDCWRELVEYARRGLPVHVAAMKTGVARNTIGAWMRRGEQEIEFERQIDDNPSCADKLPDTYEDGIKRSRVYADFYVEMMKARAERQLECVEKIIEHGQDPKNWTALAWYLERSDPERWGRKEQVAISGPGGGPVEVVPSGRQEELARAVLHQAMIMSGRALSPSEGRPSLPPAPSSAQEGHDG